MNGSRVTLAGSLLALTSAAIGLVVAFGVNVTPDQQRALLTFVTAAIVVAGVVHISRKVGVVHEIVNSHHDELVARVAQLENKLVAHDVAIPPTPPAAASSTEP